MKTIALCLMALNFACGDENQLQEIEDEPVRCEQFCKPSGIKMFEKKPNGNEICMCNNPVKE